MARTVEQMHSNRGAALKGIDNNVFIVFLMFRPTLHFHLTSYHMAALLLIFKGTSLLFSLEAVLEAVPSNGGQMSSLLHVLTSTCYFCDLIIVILPGLR